MFDTFEDRLKKLEEDTNKSGYSSQAPFALFIGVRTTDRRPDAVSTVLICPDRIELYGVQQLSGAVPPLEEKQKR